MAGPALLVARFAGIKLDLFLDRSLLMRVVAGKTQFMFFRILERLGTVFPFLQISCYLFVANQAVIRLEEPLAPFPISSGLG